MQEEKKTPSTEKKLTRKQRMQICVRKVTDKKPHWIFPVSACIVLFVMMILTDQIPHATITADTEDYENIGLQLTFTGDTAIARYVQDIADKEGYEVLFADVKDVWANSDFVFTNVEYALLIEDESAYYQVDKKVTLFGYTDSIYAMLEAGINVFSYANNHSSDYGDRAFLDAIAWMWENDLNFSGYMLREENYLTYAENDTLWEMYESFTEQAYTTLTTEDGTNIGYLSVVDGGTSDVALSKHAFKCYYRRLYQSVKESATENDLTIVYLHSGVEADFIVSDSQKKYAYALIDAGADIVIETHTHTLMPIEFYDDGIIFYGIGNFIFDQMKTFNRDSVIVQYNCNEDGGYFELIPVRINDGIPQITASQFYIDRINHQLVKNLSESDYYIDTASGHVIIPWSKGA